jgi:CBS domain-containing protein
MNYNHFSGYWLPRKSVSEASMRVDALTQIAVARLAVIATDATVRTVAVALSRPQIGLAVVCDGSGTIAGVISKSDLVRHFTLGGVADAPVVSRMSRNIVSCRSEDDLYATWQIMAARSLQSIPVLGPGSKPLGVLDIRDAMKALFEQEVYQEQLLFNYVAGVGYQ